jgi:MFS transporter, FSR family, fosmidomycin resistance protein
LDKEGSNCVVRIRKKSATRPVLLGVSGLLVALSVEFVDELADGTKSAALPLIRADLSLSYVQIGLLASVPLLLGSLLELPVGLLSGDASRRWRLILAGGVIFTASLALTALARSFWTLLVALVIFYPASGAFVGLTQSALMDAEPDRRAQHMARWNLAGSAGAVAGPGLLVAAIALGDSWRLAFLLLAVAAALACLAVIRSGPLRVPPAEPGAPGEPAGKQPPGGPVDRPPGGGAAYNGPAAGGPAAGEPADREPADREPADGESVPLRQAIDALRRGDVRRWLLLLQVEDLLLDVFSGFLALYLVAVVRASPAQAALGVGIQLAARLAGDVLSIWLLERLPSTVVLRAGAATALVLYPAFLAVPGLVPKLVILAALSIATAPWYPVIQAELYHSLPGRSGVAVSLTSAASLLGALGPLAVGLLAQRFGLSWAVTGLAIAPAVILLGIPRRTGRPPGNQR